MSRFISERLSSLKAYVPGEQPQDKKYIKLNTNESPFPPSEEVVKAAEAEARRLELYPDPECRELKKALADRYEVRPENVISAHPTAGHRGIQRTPGKHVPFLQGFL